MGVKLLSPHLVVAVYESGHLVVYYRQVQVYKRMLFKDEPIMSMDACYRNDDTQQQHKIDVVCASVSSSMVKVTLDLMTLQECGDGDRPRLVGDDDVTVGLYSVAFKAKISLFCKLE